MRRRRPASTAAGASRATRRRPMTRSQTAAAVAAEAAAVAVAAVAAEAAEAAASAVAERLADEIIVEILSRLPVKSLIQFRCVCKRWRSLISNPGFARLHLQRLKAGDMVSSQRIVKSGPMETIDYEAFDGGGADGRAAAIRSHDPRNDDPVVVGSCDGLVCFKVRGGFLLYNPTTGESRNVPISDLDLTGEGKFFHGFGYDPAFDEYKIVHVYYVEDPGMWWVAIFSLRSGSWRRMMVQLDIHPGGFNTNYPPIYSGLGFGWHKSRQGICWNGALHWCLELRELSNIDLYDSKPVIVSFNLSEENFHREIPVPNLDAMMRISIVGLGIHGANLLMYVGTPHFFMAWIMKENGIGGSWEELYKVSTGGIYILTWQQIPIVYTRREKIVFELGSSEMILFNPQHGNVEGYPIRVNGGSAIYIETLVSPYLGCEP